MSEFAVIDFVSTKLDSRLQELVSKNKQVQVIDMMMQGPSKGLIIDVEMSASWRRINNRVYSSWGQRDGVASYTKPFPKPVILNHDTSSDPMGRVIGGQYIDITDTAMHQMKNIGLVNKYRQAIAAHDMSMVADWLHASNVLYDNAWTGTGIMQATAKITDPDAIEKFLDGRYLTFSQGATPSRHINCSVCLNDWLAGDYCDHVPGQIYDGKVAVLMYDGYDPDEISVVNEPAYNQAMVRSMRISDHLLEAKLLSLGAMAVDRTTVYLTDMICRNDEVFQSAAKTEFSHEDNGKLGKDLPTSDMVSNIESEDTMNLDEAMAALKAEFTAALADQRTQFETALQTIRDTAPKVVEPVVDQVAIDAAVQVVTDAKALVDAEVVVLTQKVTDLEADLATALKDLETAQAEVKSIIDTILKKAGKTIEDAAEAKVWALADLVRVPDLKPIDNPGVAGSQPDAGPSLRDKLGDFEKKIVVEYQNLVDTENVAAAELYFSRKAKYVAHDFHPKNFLTKKS